MLLTLLLDFHYDAPPIGFAILILVVYTVPVLAGLCVAIWGALQIKSEQIWQRRLGLLALISATLGTVGVVAWLVANTSLGNS